MTRADPSPRKALWTTPPNEALDFPPTRSHIPPPPSRPQGPGASRGFVETTQRGGLWGAATPLHFDAAGALTPPTSRARGGQPGPVLERPAPMVASSKLRRRTSLAPAARPAAPLPPARKASLLLVPGARSPPALPVAVIFASREPVWPRASSPYSSKAARTSGKEARGTGSPSGGA